MLRYKPADTQKNNYKFRKTSMTPIKPFHLDIPDETIAHIKSRVAEYPWHEMPDDGGWDYGVNMNYLKEFCAYWAKDYDLVQSFSRQQPAWTSHSIEKRSS